MAGARRGMGVVEEQHQQEVERFKVLYETYKDKIDEVLELARLYQKFLVHKEDGKEKDEVV